MYKMVASKLKIAKSMKVYPVPRLSISFCVIRAKIKTKVKRVKLAHAMPASSAISATYVKKKLP